MNLWTIWKMFGQVNTFRQIFEGVKLHLPTRTSLTSFESSAGVFYHEAGVHIFRFHVSLAAC